MSIFDAVVINPRTGQEFRGSVIVPDGEGYGQWSRIHCDAWSDRAEMYSLAGENVFVREAGECPWMKEES